MPQSAVSTPERPRSRAERALRARHNWAQLAKFCLVGGSGYAINLGVYAALLGLGAHTAAVFSFIVAGANNYWWNRHWTFRGQQGHFAYQGMRFVVVSVVALGANLVVLRVLVAFGVGKVLAQAITIIVVTPLNFSGNKLWSFAR